MMRRRRPALLESALLGLVAAAFAAPTRILAQCAMCGSAAASSPGVARGLAYSIFFLLGALALVVTWFIALVLRSQAPLRRRGLPQAPAAGVSPIAASAVATGHAPAED
jgi:hypothetical protein